MNTVKKRIIANPDCPKCEGKGAYPVPSREKQERESIGNGGWREYVTFQPCDCRKIPEPT